MATKTPTPAELMADMDAHLRANGIDPARYNGRNGEHVVERAMPRNPNPGMVTPGRPAAPGYDDIDNRRMLDMRPRAGRLARKLIGDLACLDMDAARDALVWHERNEPTLTVGQCSEWINRLRAKIKTYNGQPLVTTTTPGVDTPVTASVRPAYDAYDDVPDGNYALDLNRDKTHFYRVSRKTRNGRTYVNVQERASDELFKIYNWDQRKAVLEDIRAVGAEASRMMFSERLGRCWHCYISLTDENNPYKIHGLGPICGPKVMG
jgi:hypothetical protein